jgi:hypothetical protein
MPINTKKFQCYFFISAAFFDLTLAQAPIFIDFDISCGKQDPYLAPFFTQCKNSEGSFFQPTGQNLELLRTHFNAKFNSNLGDINNYRIPKIIHLIWLGSPFPHKFLKFLQSWKLFHPHWLIIVWDDKMAEKIQLKNRDLYERASLYCEKSDILRYEVLYQFGGLYVDTDFECLKSFDIFHQCYDFYTGMFSLDEATLSSPMFGNALIGSIPGHPFLKQLIEAIRKPANDTLARTGPIRFTEELYNYLLADKLVSIVFPPTYFYSLRSIPGYNRQYSDWKPRIESYAVHWYGW